MKNHVAHKRGGIIYFDNTSLPSKQTIMLRMGVKRRTFAGNMVARLYDFYFGKAIDFNKEYRKYYKKEYSTLVDYMEQHYNVSHEDAVFMAQGSFSMKNCFCDSVERNIETVCYDKNLMNAFSEAVGGLVDEDSDGVYYE